MSPALNINRCLSVIFTFLIVAFILQPGTARAQVPGVGVDNDGPSFIDIDISETDEVIYVNVEVRDLNGWNDIFSINVTIFDNQGRPISRVNYMQYSSLDSTSVATILWNETTGSYLDRTRSAWTPIPVSPWNPENALVEIGVRVTFAFQKFSGQNINILTMDRGMLTCEYSGPFSAEYTPAPVFEGVAVPISLSSVVAAVAALLMVFRRHSNNKLARAVEAAHTPPDED